MPGMVASTVKVWYGESLGHPFRGNQWTDGIGSSVKVGDKVGYLKPEQGEEDLVGKVKEINDVTGRAHVDWGDGGIEVLNLTDIKVIK